MLFSTLKAKLTQEARWLQAWGESEKKVELWNVIAELTEQLYNRDFNPEKSYFTFSRFSSGVSSSMPKKRTGEFAYIAIIKPWDYPKFRELWNNFNYSSKVQQEDALSPIVDDVFNQVYGKRI